jgi:phage terminase large subunit-like protein
VSLSLAEQYALASDDERVEIDREFFPSDAALAARAHDWSFWGRPEQQWAPGWERNTLALAGRGWGKGAMAAHAANLVGMNPEMCGGRPAKGPDDRRAGEGAFFGIGGRTANDRNQTLIDGDSGIMAACDPALRPEWRKSDGLLVWPTGVRARLISGEEPDTCRGPNLGFLILDELAHYAKAAEVWKQAGYALRKAARGHHPRALVTSTPLGTDLICSIAFEMQDGAPVPAPPGTPPDRVLQGFLINRRTRVVVGSSYDNWANLDHDFRVGTLGQYEGTADGDQEIHGVIRLGTPGALWRQDWFQRQEDPPEHMDRVIVAIDPTVSDGVRVRGSDEICECGIVGAGVIVARRKAYMLADRSLVAHPSEWARVAVELALEIGATEIVAEGNNGDTLIPIAIDQAWSRRRSEFKDRRKPRVAIVKAHRNKPERAGLAAPAWEAGKVVHVGPARRWVALERQQTSYDPNRPHDRQQADRMDAAVWAMLSLLGDGTDRARVQALTDAEGLARVLAQMRARAGRR